MQLNWVQGEKHHNPRTELETRIEKVANIFDQIETSGQDNIRHNRIDLRPFCWLKMFIFPAPNAMAMERW